MFKCRHRQGPPDATAIRRVPGCQGGCPRATYLEIEFLGRSKVQVTGDNVLDPVRQAKLQNRARLRERVSGVWGSVGRYLNSVGGIGSGMSSGPHTSPHMTASCFPTKFFQSAWPPKTQSRRDRMRIWVAHALQSHTDATGHHPSPRLYADDTSSALQLAHAGSSFGRQTRACACILPTDCVKSSAFLIISLNTSHELSGEHRQNCIRGWGRGRKWHR